MPAAVACSVAPERCRPKPLPFPAPPSVFSTTPAFASAAKRASPPVHEANDTPADIRDDQLHQAPTDLNDITRNIIKLYKPARWLSVLLRETSMHALSRSRLCRRMPFPGTAQGSRNGHCQLDRRQMYRMPLLHHHLSLLTFRASSGRAINPRVTKCELCSSRLEKGLKPGCTTRVSHWRRDLRTTHDAAARSQAAHRQTARAATTKTAYTAKTITAAPRLFISPPCPSKN